MPALPPLLEGWLNRAKALPRWAWGLIGLAILALAAIPLGLLDPYPQAAAAPSDPGDPASSVQLAVDVFLKFGVVLLLIYVCLLVLRKWQIGRSGAATRRLAVLETTRLSPRQALHLVRVGEKTVLIGATDQSLSLLAELPAGDDAPSADELPFAAHLTQVLHS